MKQTTVIYDGGCNVCSSTAAWIHREDTEGAFDMVSCQSETLGMRYPAVKRAACMKAMHVVLPDGTILAGEKALPVIVKGLPRFRIFTPLFSLLERGGVGRALYAWFANRRYLFARLFGADKRL